MQLNEPYSSHVAEPRDSAPSRSTIGNVTWLPRQRDALTADTNQTIELAGLERPVVSRRRGVGCAAGEWVRPASFWRWADVSG
jgi:hypothetical protein